MSKELFRSEQRDWVQSFTENYSDFFTATFLKMWTKTIMQEKICPGLQSIRGKHPLLSATKGTLALLINFTIASDEKYGQ